MGQKEKELDHIMVVDLYQWKSYLTFEVQPIRCYDQNYNLDEQQTCHCNILSCPEQVKSPDDSLFQQPPTNNLPWLYVDCRVKLAIRAF